MSDAKIPVFLLTGFLGSGKTTLLNAALKSPALANTAVVVNELGEIGLDQVTIAEATDNVVLLDAGCLCCTNSGALHETLADLWAKRVRGEVPPYQRIVIETSGAADPAPLLNILLGHPLVTDHYALEAVVCTLDAQHFLESREKFPELDKQLAVADRVYVTKSDLVDPLPVMKHVNAEVVFSPETAFSPNAKKHKPPSILKPLQSFHTRFRALSFRPEHVTWAGWAAWTQFVKQEFGERLLRVKGLLRMDDTGEIVLVQGVQGVFHKPQRFADWPDAERGNRLVCISKEMEQQEIEATLFMLNAEPGTQAQYSLKDVKKRQATT